MFERRLKVLLWIFGPLTAAVVARLVQMQVVRADAYRDAARQVLLRPMRLLPCVRGRILDRAGRVLAEDQPCWDVSVPYPILAGDPDYLRALAEELKQDESRSKMRVTSADVEQLRNRTSAMWPAIATATGTPLEELADRRERIVQRVRRLQALREERGFDRSVAEERLAHPVVRGLTHERAVQARISLARFPWVRIADGTARAYAPEPALAHLLGRLADPGPDAVFTQDAPAELAGAAGVERLANDRLQGQRGRIIEDITGAVVRTPEPPRDGADVRLTIDAGLQRRIYERLGAAAGAIPSCTGAAAVVIDVIPREVLAMASFPAYPPNPDAEQRRLLQDDRKTLPMLDRSISEVYPPGSTVKPLVLAAALTAGGLTPQTAIECQGRLFPDKHVYECTGIHGPVTATFAIQHSCNVYFYKVGESLGVPLMRHWLEAAGFGRPSGTGLLEETAGNLPEATAPGEARNVAVGQGELNATPVQVANLIATVACGQHRPVTILRDDYRDRPARSLGVSAATWAVVRQGMYDVVNAPGGTAHDKAMLPPEPWVLLGKTGSAQSWARPLDRRYTVEWPDGRREEIIAADKRELTERLRDRSDYKIVGNFANRRWPEDDPLETHAWFAGYLVDRGELSRLGEPPLRAVAFAIVLEYAGGGGAMAGPVGGDVARYVLDVWPER